MFIYRLYTYSITLTYIEIWRTSYDMCKLHVYFSYVEYPRLTISLFWWWVSPIPKSWDINPKPLQSQNGLLLGWFSGISPGQINKFCHEKMGFTMKNLEGKRTQKMPENPMVYRNRRTSMVGLPHLSVCLQEVIYPYIYRIIMDYLLHPTTTNDQS